MAPVDLFRMLTMDHHQETPAKFMLPQRIRNSLIALACTDIIFAFLACGYAWEGFGVTSWKDPHRRPLEWHHQVAGLYSSFIYVAMLGFGAVKHLTDSGPESAQKSTGRQGFLLAKIFLFVNCFSPFLPIAVWLWVYVSRAKSEGLQDSGR